MKRRSTKNGSANDDWETPGWILKWVYSNYGDFFDPCPLQAKFDGLEVYWDKVNYINPPYSQKLKDAFVLRAIWMATFSHNIPCVCVCLIPAVTDTKLFQVIWENASKILFIHGRVKFKGVNTRGEYVINKSGQTGSMIVVFDGKRKDGDGSIVVGILSQDGVER
jgi:hypothetical protein